MLKFGSRSLALFLSLSLGLSESAFALRNQQKEDPSQLSGLEEALKDPAKAFQQLAQMITPSPSQTRTVGPKAELVAALQVTSSHPAAGAEEDQHSTSASDWMPGRLHVSPEAIGRLISLDLKLLISDYDGTLEVNRVFQRSLERRVLYPFYVAGTTPSPEQVRAFDNLLDDRNQRFDALYEWVGEHRLDRTAPYPSREEMFAVYLQQARGELEGPGGEIASTLRLIPSARELFGGLTRHKVAFIIATNDFTSVKQLQLRRNGFDVYVRSEDVHGLSDSGTDKLSKEEVLRQAMASRGFTSHQIAMLGDTVQEVWAARATGVLSLAIAESAVARAALLDAGADIVMDGDYNQWRELLELLFLTVPATKAEGSDEQQGEESCISRALEERYKAVIDAQSHERAADRYAAVPVAPQDLKDLASLLILQVLLLHRRGKTVKMHPQGFLQMNLTDFARWQRSGGGLRFHIWDPTLPKPDAIFNRWHKHNFKSNSIVMLGRMADEIYDVVPAGTAGAVGPVRRKYATPMYTNITPTDELVQIQKRLERPIPTGGLVYYPIEDYHLTVPSGELTATLFYKHDWGESQEPGFAIGPEKVPDLGQRQDRRTYSRDLALGAVHRVMTQLARTYGLGDVPAFEPQQSAQSPAGLEERIPLAPGLTTKKVIFITPDMASPQLFQSLKTFKPVPGEQLPLVVFAEHDFHVEEIQGWLNQAGLKALEIVNVKKEVDEHKGWDLFDVVAAKQAGYYLSTGADIHTIWFFEDLKGLGRFLGIAPIHIQLWEKSLERQFGTQA